MPRNDLEDTVELNQEEMDDALHQDRNSNSSNKKFMILVGLAILLFFMVALCLILLFSGSDDNTTTPQATPTPTTEAQTSTLSSFEMEKMNAVIIDTLDQEYGSDGYTHPTDDDYTISGTKDNLTVTCRVMVGKEDAMYEVPLTFHLKWSTTNETFDVDSFVNEDTHQQTQTQNPSTNEAISGEEVSSFDVTVQNSITVTITSQSEGKVSAVAIASDGTQTVIATATNETVTQTKELETGEYTIALYAENGTGYSWSYSLG